MRNIIAVLSTALLGLVTLAGCGVGAKTYNTAEEVAEAIGCSNVRTEGSILGDVTACNVGEASFGILSHSEQIEQAWHHLSQVSGGAFAKVGKFLVSSSDTTAAKIAFDKLGVQGTYIEPTPEPSKPAGEPSEDPTGPVEGKPSESESPYEEEEAAEAEFGETITTAMGNSVTVTGIRYEKATESNCCVDEGSFIVVFTVKLTNNTDKPLKDLYITATASYGSDGEEAESVNDDGIKDGIEGTIRKGKSKVGEYAFAIPKNQTGDVQLELDSTALFYGAAKETM